jgi:hypothetical protein
MDSRFTLPAGVTVIRTKVPALAAAVFATLLAAAPAAAFNETGGSGLIHTEQAYSLPIGRPLFSLYTGAYSNDFTPGSSRLLTMTPSVTLGLGARFEASAALGFEGLTSSLDSGEFTRRFDFRRRALQTKLRWTTEFGGPRLRGGVLGSFTMPMGEDQRPGATVSADNDYDAGVMALVSSNLGWFAVPVRLHLNAGYWWSRDDGAFVYRGLPTSIPVAGVAADQNDVLEYGLAVEAGLRRAVVFVELRSEQFVDARSVMTSRENLWQLTPGFRTQLSSSVGLTGGVSFNLSKDDGATAFDADTSYPDYEFKLGLTLGSVLSRERREEASRNRRRSLLAAPGPGGAEQGSWVVTEIAVPDTVSAPEAALDEAAPLGAVVDVADVEPAATAPKFTDARRIRELEDRLARLETAQRLFAIETRLAALELSPAAAAQLAVVPSMKDTVSAGEIAVQTVAPLPAAPAITAPADSTPAATAPAPATPAPDAAATPAPAPASSPAREVTAAAPTISPDVMRQLESLQMEMQGIREQQAREIAAVEARSAARSATSDSLATIKTAVPAAPAPTDSPGVQSQVDRLQGAVQVLLEQQAAAAKTPPATPIAAAPIAAPAPVPAAPTTVVVALDPELLQPYRSTSAAPAGSEPAAAAAVSAPSPAVTPVVKEVVASPPPPFGLEVGERRTLTGIDVMASSPLSDAAAVSRLDELAAEISAGAGAGVVLLVHGGGEDRAAALADTERLALLIRDYLVAAGAPAESIASVGMGRSEPGTPRVEIERIR